jgi:hypothetical protein
MDLKDKLISSFWAFDGHKDDDAYLQKIRTEAIKSFKEKGFPTKKEEAWKYTSLNRLLKNDFSVFSRKENALEYRDVKIILFTKLIRTKSCLSMENMHLTYRKLRMKELMFASCHQH